MRKNIFRKVIMALIVGLLMPVFSSCDRSVDDLQVSTRSSDAFLSLSASYSYSGEYKTGINFDIFGTNTLGYNVNVGILSISVYYLDVDNNRLVKVYQFNQLDNGTIQAGSNNVDLRLGGSLNGNLFSFWDDRFDYYLEVKSDNAILGSNIVLVN